MAGFVGVDGDCLLHVTYTAWPASARRSGRNPERRASVSLVSLPDHFHSSILHFAL